ncbi:MAG: hypothetical protein ACI4RL_04630, partial [Ruminococcus sp.]
MNLFIKKIVSLLVSICLLMTFIFLICTGAHAKTNYILSKKIDRSLLDCLLLHNDEDVLPVAIWFDEIDSKSVNNAIESKLNEKIRNKEISKETRDLYK